MRCRTSNWDAFVSELLFFCMLVAVFIVIAVYQLYLNQWLQIRWRRWMTQRYLSHWLDGSNHYRMQLLGDAADNPDQRIAEDINLFIEKGLYLGLGLLNAVVTLGSFVVILWTLSASAPFTLFGIDWAIPGYLVWAALIYSIAGTAIIHWIGKPLIDLNFTQQRYEADFRFNLIRVRENSEQIALLDGEAAENRTAAGSLRPRGRQLDADHVAHQEADVLQRGLCPGVDRIPLRGRQPGLFRGLDSARRPDADRIGLQQRAGRAVVLRQLDRLSPARRMARGDRPARRLPACGRGGSRGRGVAAGRRGRDGRGQRRRSDRRCRRQSAGWQAAGGRRWARDPARRPRAGHRTVGIGQVDAVPRHRAASGRSAKDASWCPRTRD